MMRTTLACGALLLLIAAPGRPAAAQVSDAPTLLSPRLALAARLRYPTPHLASLARR